MKKQVYKDPRPAEVLLPYYQYARGPHLFPVYYIAWLVMAPIAQVFYRLQVRGRRNVPKKGAVILAPNHFSIMDHFLMGAYVMRKIRFMAKSQMFKYPMVVIYKHGGVFPVRRGHRDEESMKTALSILSNGGTVAMYCEGGRQRNGKMADKAKRGIGRLALETGAPVIPTAINGSEKARNWKHLRFSPVNVTYGRQLQFKRNLNPTEEEQQAAADAIFAEIKALYDQVEQKNSERHPAATFFRNYWLWSLMLAFASYIICRKRR